jgi:hypothetical protein
MTPSLAELENNRALSSKIRRYLRVSERFLLKLSPARRITPHTFLP